MKKRSRWREAAESAKKSPALFTVYLILRVIVVVMMILQVFNRNWNDVFFCALTLVLFMIPSFVERRIKVDVPDTLEIIILFFIFAAEILGEIRGYYYHVTGWDTALHTANGFLSAAIGLALIDILNRTDRFAFNLSPLFVVMVSFCFSMTVGVLWEFFEYGMDVFFGGNMQKFMTESGEPFVGQAALSDTMKDLLVNFIGAAVFSIIGYFHIKNRGKGRESKFVRRFMLTKIKDTEKPAGSVSKESAAGEADAKTQEQREHITK